MCSTYWNGWLVTSRQANLRYLVISKLPLSFAVWKHVHSSCMYTSCNPRLPVETYHGVRLQQVGRWLHLVDAECDLRRRAAAARRRLVEQPEEQGAAIADRRELGGRVGVPADGVDGAGAARRRQHAMGVRAPHHQLALAAVVTCRVRPPLRLWNWRIFKAFQGFSRLFKGFQRFSRVFKGFQGFSRHFEAFQGFTRLFKAFQGFSRLFKAFQGFYFTEELKALFSEMEITARRLPIADS